MSLTVGLLGILQLLGVDLSFLPSVIKYLKWDPSLSSTDDGQLIPCFAWSAH